MLKITKNQNFLRHLAICLLLVGMSFSAANGQSNKTPEGRVKNFYGWYLKSINDGHEPSRPVMNSHLSRRFSRWYYSKAGQNLDYDIFVNGQDWNEAWEGNVYVVELAIKRTTAVVNITLGAYSDSWILRLKVSLIKEGVSWKIDRVKGL